MWRHPTQGAGSSRRPQGPRVRSNNTDDPSINAADANVQAFKLKRLTKEEKDKRNKNNECYYCGKPGHFAHVNAASAIVEIGEAGRVSTPLEPESWT
jgi:hypothetical protein